MLRPLLLCALATLAAACDDATTDVAPIVPARIEYVGPVLSYYHTTDTVTVHFRVLDDGGVAIPGVRVDFSVAAGEVTLSAASAMTDSVGRAPVKLTLGVAPGENEVQARVAGLEEPARLVFSPIPRLTLTTTPDTLVLTAPGCRSFVTGRLRYWNGEYQWGRVVDYRVEDPAIVRLDLISGSGTTAGLSREVVALRVGVTRIIGTFHESSDTVVARVESDSVASFQLNQHVAGLAPGDTVRVSATARYTGACGTVPGVVPSFRSLTPAVAEVGSTGLVTARAPGFGAIVAEWGRFSDTLRVEVRTVSVQPADTTVFVGDTVLYRAATTDADGVTAPQRISAVATSDRTVAGLLGAPESADAMVFSSTSNSPRGVVARKPGVVTIRLYAWAGTREVRVTVREAVSAEPD